MCKQITIIKSSSVRSASIDFLSLSIRTYYPSFLAGFPNYILGLHRADVDKFLLVGQCWHVHV